MKKYRIIAFCFTSLFLLLTGCQSNDSQAGKNIEPSLAEEASAQERPSSVDGVTVTPERTQYPTSVETIVVIIQNDSNTEFTSGAHVFLEKKVNNTWYSIPMKEEAFTEQGVIHRSGETSSLPLKVGDLDYELTPGEYRATIGGLAAPFKIVE